MEIWLDRAVCQGDCVCELICPEVFALDGDGIAFVREDRDPPDPSELEYWVQIGQSHAGKVTEAAEECPMHCIHVRGGSRRT
jgi:ferredoxin